MEKTFQFSGPMALLVGVVALIIIGIRLASMGGNSDPELEEAVRQELWSDHAGGMVSQLRQKFESGSMAKGDVEKVGAEAISILKIGTSKPLLSMSTNERVIVFVRYMVPDDDNVHEKYMEFTNATLGGWRYRYRSSVISYYLNLF
ncbi:hypothetical protein BOW53_09760 [Solemya pervernicosa gill symbiont]|uniref:Uncharacterized protein n=2 Tax=Gammaproteobacteria incertae sedis TaxID=118884 RepID=A0A1T2L486_9GAMM|nr:hypothetical protein [Candidatus Reidiella endopervernicosa]OOZ39881.1 hypothetical protein BOW53_09760 [Solemya pervernicosa gill symbiont]QKQ25809.1 hypothetical protein HUE57_05585 [Candidatus Reidiella endopervernicosa]